MKKIAKLKNHKIEKTTHWSPNLQKNTYDQIPFELLKLKSLRLDVHKVIIEIWLCDDGNLP
jgi:hypothetical protein